MSIDGRIVGKVNGRHKPTTHWRVFPETKIKAIEISREIAKIGGEKPTLPELTRRIFNIPNLKDVLVNDAKVKEKMKRGFI